MNAWTGKRCRGKSPIDGESIDAAEESRRGKCTSVVMAVYSCISSIEWLREACDFASERVHYFLIGTSQEAASVVSFDGELENQTSHPT